MNEIAKKGNECKKGKRKKNQKPDWANKLSDKAKK